MKNTTIAEIDLHKEHICIQSNPVFTEIVIRFNRKNKAEKNHFAFENKKI